MFEDSGKTAADFASYRKFLRLYEEFAREYERVQRLWPGAPLMIETDTFLNFLFHEAEEKPSFAFYNAKTPRKMLKEDRPEEIERWAKRFALWLADHPDESYRIRESELIRELLAKTRVDEISRQDVQSVVDSLHCMNSQQLIRHKFLNPQNNELDDIRDAWKILLHGNGGLEERMQDCERKLKFFGPSSRQELLGWFYPDRYPIKNSNSEAGLRFFGYDI
jgi:hypothetical protein